MFPESGLELFISQVISAVGNYMILGGKDCLFTNIAVSLHSCTDTAASFGWFFKIMYIDNIVTFLFHCGTAIK